MLNKGYSNNLEIIDLDNSDSILYVKEAPFLKHPYYIFPKEEIKEEEKSYIDSLKLDKN